MTRRDVWQRTRDSVLKMARHRDLPFTVRLALVMIAVSLLTALIIGLTSVVFLRGQLAAEMQQRNQHRASATSRTLDMYLTGLTDSLKETANLPVVAAFLSQPSNLMHREEVERHLSRLVGVQGFQAVAITDRSGTVLVASDRRLLGTSFANSPVFVWAMGGLSPVDDPAYEPSDGRIYIHASAPVSVIGSVIGTIIGRVTLDRIDAIISADSDFAGYGEFGVLWDESGIRLSQPSNPGLRLRPLTDLPEETRQRMIATSRFGPGTGELLRPVSPWSEAVLRSRLLVTSRSADPNVRVLSPDGTALQVSIAPLQRKSWFYAIATPETSINAATASMWRLLLGISLVTATTIGIATYPIARSFLRIPQPSVAVADGIEQSPVQAEPTAASAGEQITSPDTVHQFANSAPGTAPQMTVQVETTTAGAPVGRRATEVRSLAKTTDTSAMTFVRSPKHVVDVLADDGLLSLSPLKTPMNYRIFTPPGNVLAMVRERQLLSIAPPAQKLELPLVYRPQLAQIAGAPNADELQPSAPGLTAPPKSELAATGTTTVEAPANDTPPKEPSEEPKGTPEKTIWGIPLARPPLGPLA